MLDDTHRFSVCFQFRMSAQAVVDAWGEAASTAGAHLSPGWSRSTFSPFLFERTDISIISIDVAWFWRASRFEKCQEWFVGRYCWASADADPKDVQRSFDHCPRSDLARFCSLVLACSNTFGIWGGHNTSWLSKTGVLKVSASETRATLTSVAPLFEETQEGLVLGIPAVGIPQLRILENLGRSWKRFGLELRAWNQLTCCKILLCHRFLFYVNWPLCEKSLAAC